MIVEGQLKPQPKPGCAWNRGLMRSTGRGRREGRGGRGGAQPRRSPPVFLRLLLRRCAVLQETKCSRIGAEIREALVAGVENAVYRLSERQIKVCVGEMETAASDF